jgi:hypothetical protein
VNPFIFIGGVNQLLKPYSLLVYPLFGGNNSFCYKAFSFRDSHILIVRIRTGSYPDGGAGVSVPQQTTFVWLKSKGSRIPFQITLLSFHCHRDHVRHGVV